ncbi:MAG: tRNA lysidine(34) synthetase TilS [Bacteroidia bacterium]
MQKKFESNIIKNQLFSKQDPLLLAISGGVDSVALAHLLKKGGFNFTLAHCNFKLRDNDSDADEAFCKALAKSLKVKLHVRSFDVKAYCKKKKVSVQMAARDLRYDWFNELISQNKINYLVTAHHANDVVETVFINLCRGTGIKGLKGIAEKAGNVVRPLLHFTKDEIEAFAKKEKIAFRTDKSNLETKYERNLLRLEIIPKLKKLHPDLENIFLSNTRNFKEEAAIIDDFFVTKNREMVSEKDSQTIINKIRLKKEKHLRSILHFILEPFNFNAAQLKDIIKHIETNGTVGKIFTAPKYMLTIDREFIFIKLNADNAQETIKIKTIKDLKASKHFKLQEIRSFKTLKNTEFVVERSKLIFPLHIRSKKTGDKFRPFGMKGFKLLSDFLKDQKLNAFEKEKCQLLENGNGDIIWVMGHRSDDRYKVSSKQKPLLKLTLLEQ